ncbi:unnamed protein product [Ilex paraguariensis]|uniref:Uncharacterized protein n=1 Tax=Ilex paraguariensis TaxID=185542 RepID=A0ABC8STI6_9AQUA
MGSKAPTWADQWGTGGFGDEGDGENKAMTNKKKLGNSSSSKKMEEVKAAASAGFDKAKAAAVVGAHKDLQVCFFLEVNELHC